MRNFQTFTWKEANFRICSSHFELITKEICKQRTLLENYIKRCPEFRTALSPIDLLPNAPEIVCRMHEASLKTGLGPMAAVAGTFAQLAAEAELLEADFAHSKLQNTGGEVIVENGGDIYISAQEEVIIGLYAGTSILSGKLAFAIEPDNTPLAICSSSGTMGHSLSLGNCDLATVVAKDASLADAAATLAGNLVKQVSDVDPAIERIISIPGIQGVLLVKEDRVGLSGDLPRLVRHQDQAFSTKITKAAGINLQQH